MAYVPDASQSEIDNGGRTFEEIMQDMKEEEKQNPGVVKKTVTKTLSRLRSEAISSVKSYVGSMAEMVREAGLSEEEGDSLVSEMFGEFMDEATDKAADGVVEGLSPEEKLQAEGLSGRPEEQAANAGTYVPDEKTTAKMSRQRQAAMADGSTAKTLTYTDAQLQSMSADELKRAAGAGMVTSEQLSSMGYDAQSFMRDSQLQFGAVEQPEVVVVDKIKSLPNYNPLFKEAKGDEGIVVSAGDMANMGKDDFFGDVPVTAEKAAQTIKDVATVGANVATKIATGTLGFEDLAKARGAMADDELHMGAIRSAEREQESAFFDSDGPSGP